MVVVRRMGSRRVFALGVAGLVPAAVVTLLLVHQPSIGARRLYPMLRGSLTVVGFGLALATLIAWATASNRLSRSSLSGLAWAGVTVLLCIGPFVESAPRARLFALDLHDGDLGWAISRAAASPVLVDGVLVVTEEEAGMLVGLDPEDGRQLWRRSIDDISAPVPPSSDITVIHGGIEANRVVEDWSQVFPGESVLAVAQSGDSVYAYVSTPGANGTPAGTIVKLDAQDGDILWQRDLPNSVAAANGGEPAIGASGDAVVIAGGERIGALDANDGELRWTQSVASLGKSRGYALPGSVQEIIVTDSLVFLSATADG